MSSNNNNKPLAGKVAIVTGSSRGIGAAIARQLASDGAAVAINYVKVRSSLPHFYFTQSSDWYLTFLMVQGADAANEVVNDIKKAGGDAHAFQADVSKRDDVYRLVDEAVQKWGRVDVFVNNSGVFGASPLEHETEEHIDSNFAINYKGTLWGIQAASKVLQPGGSIINLSSVLARITFPVSELLPSSATFSTYIHVKAPSLTCLATCEGVWCVF